MDYILSFVAHNTVGSPTDSSKQWVNLRPCDIVDHIFENYQINVSNRQVKRILRANGYCPYKPLKRLATGASPDRAVPFAVIAELRALFAKMPHNPVLSIDTKKKESLGLLTRNQPVWTKKETIPEVYDHDYSELSEGKAIPHGIYDLKNNQGYVSLGNSHETADFVVDNLKW